MAKEIKINGYIFKEVETNVYVPTEPIFDVDFNSWTKDLIDLVTYFDKKTKSVICACYTNTGEAGQEGWDYADKNNLNITYTAGSLSSANMRIGGFNVT